MEDTDNLQENKKNLEKWALTEKEGTDNLRVRAFNSHKQELSPMNEITLRPMSEQQYKQLIGEA